MTMSGCLFYDEAAGFLIFLYEIRCCFRNFREAN
jgi:hypothetical protein